jgi:hypothetical protein
VMSSDNVFRPVLAGRPAASVATIISPGIIE